MYAAALAATALLLAHDVYGDLRSREGNLCCTGDPVRGDCEWAEYRLLPDGDVEMLSHRHRTWIHVAHQMVVWLPIPGSDRPAHWCGVRRMPVLPGQMSPLTPENPDPRFFTYCAFIDPGGA
ncbi:hypothetical protein [Alsobacter sp. SYSU BS001988]